MTATAIDSDSLWIAKKDACRICATVAQPEGISQQHFDNTIRPRIAAEFQLGNRKGLKFFAPAVVIAWVAYRMDQDAPKPAPGIDDPLMLGGDSPALERYRTGKAEMIEMDLEERRKTHVNVKALDGAIVRYASLLHRGGEVLQRRFGNDAADVFNSAIDEAERSWRAEAAQYDSDNSKDAEPNGARSGD